MTLSTPNASEDTRFDHTGFIDIRGVRAEYLVHRFIFSIPGGAYQGFLLFGREEYNSARISQVAITVFLPDDVEAATSRDPIELLTAYVEHLPTTAVIKDTAGKVLWCNYQYLAVARRSMSAHVIGKTFAEIFTGAQTGEISDHEQRVINEGKAILASIRLSEALVRTGIRFPIFDVVGKLMYVAGVGAERGPMNLAGAR
jgi:hypothetical protein